MVYATRPWPGWRFYLLTVVALGVGFALGMLDPSHNPAYGGAGALGMATVWFGLALSGLVERHRVHDNAVVLGATLPGMKPYVVPIDSIRPDTLTVHHRANLINRRLHQNGQPPMRMAFYSTRAVSFIGLNYEAAQPAASHATRIGRRTAELLLAGDRTNAPISRWVCGVRNPRGLVEALEQVLVAHGAVQPGLAARVVAAPVVEPSGEPARG